MPTTIPIVSPVEKDIRTARQRYVEIYGSSLMMNRYLRICVLCLSGVAVGLIALNIRTHQIFSRFKPLVIRISDVGRAEAITYDSMEYRPKDAEIRYFLIDFVTKHYGRMRATVRENFARSLFFLDGRLADATIEANKKNKTIETFIAGQGAEVEIAVHNVAIEDLRTSPIRASVDFDKIYYASSDHFESKREHFTAHLVFVVKDRVPNAFIPVNPLGLTITYFREDQAFQ